MSVFCEVPDGEADTALYVLLASKRVLMSVMGGLAEQRVSHNVTLWNSIT
jgi:hypothetical protein